MTESRFKKIVTACTVGAVLLIVILLSVLVSQLISINVEVKKKKELDDAIAHYEQLIKDGADTLEAVQERWWIERRARELGLIYPDDIVFKK